MKTANQALRRAIVMTSVAYRASLEVTVHPRSEAISVQLLTWLDNLGLASDIDPIERELLAAPFGQLEDSQKLDASWSGEGANVHCWALGLTAEPPPTDFVDYIPWFDRLLILRGNALLAFHDAKLISIEELCDFHIRAETLRTALQIARMSPSTRQLLRNACLLRISELGLEAHERDLDHAIRQAECFTPEERQRVPGLCIVRSLASSWLMDDRVNYFETEQK